MSWSKTKKFDNFELVKYIRVTQMFRLILGEFLSVKNDCVFTRADVVRDWDPT